MKFEHRIFEEKNHQGNAVINYTAVDVPYTRKIEHKHFEPKREYESNKTVVSYEYPVKWEKGMEPYYPINDENNNKLYAKYKTLAEQQEKVVFGGRLGTYRYLDMHQVIEEALKLAESELGGI